MFQQFEQRRHRVAHGLPARRHIARPPQIDGIVAVAGQSRGWYQARGDARLEQLAIPFTVRVANQFARHPRRR